MKNRSSQISTSLWQKTALVLLGLLLFLVLLEAGLRLGGFVLLSIQEYGNLRSIKQKGAYRILCLGESTTRGAYPRPLEKILNQRNIGVRFSVVDKGIPGTNTSAVLNQVGSYLAEYHPNMVVAMMGINDRGEHIPFEAAAVSKGAPFIRSLRIYNLARLLWLHLVTNAEEMGGHKPDADRRSSEKAQTSVPETGIKETSAENISAEGSFEKAIEIYPKNDDIYVGVGRLYREQGKLSQAEGFFKKAVELNPKNDNAYVELGRLYHEQGKSFQSGDFYKKAIEINPRNDVAYVGLGRICKSRGDFLQAEAFFKRAIALNPKNDRAYANLGWLYRGQAKFPQAENCFEKTVELNTSMPTLYFLELAALYREQGKLSQAENVLEKAIEVNPNNALVLEALASLCKEMGKPGLAQEYSEKAHSLGLDDTAAVTADNYRRLMGILDRKGIKLVCAQYPMRNVERLKRIFKKDEGVIFVDNESIFKEAVRRSSYKEYFRDIFGGDFGHCTQKGNELLAQNIADVILKEVFNQQ